MSGAKSLRGFKAEFFKALAHPLRIHVLEALREREQSVGELREILGVELANVSQQLAILRAKNIVSARKQGTTVYYTVTDPALFRLLDAAKEIFNNHLIGLQDILQGLNEK